MALKETGKKIKSYWCCVEKNAWNWILFFVKVISTAKADIENVSGHNDLSFETDHISQGKLTIKLFYNLIKLSVIIGTYNLS